jgi:hypothetical protein
MWKRFCDLDKRFHLVKGRGESCENNFECLSSDCKSGECFDLYKEVTGEERRGSFLRKILCTILHPFDDVARNACIDG